MSTTKRKINHPGKLIAKFMANNLMIKAGYKEEDLDTVLDIIDGVKDVTKENVKLISSLLDTSDSVWLNLQDLYHKNK